RDGSHRRDRAGEHGTALKPWSPQPHKKDNHMQGSSHQRRPMASKGRRNEKIAIALDVARRRGARRYADGGEAASEAPALFESLGRGALSAATSGTGGFEDALGLAQSRERREAAKRANPYTYFMGELLGTPAAVPIALTTPLAIALDIARRRAAKASGG